MPEVAEKDPGQYYYSLPERDPDKRRKPPGAKNSFVVSEMWERHHEIVRRLALGQKNVEIAKALGISEVSVSQVKNSPVVQEKLMTMTERMDNEAVDVGKRIRELAPLAIKTLEGVLEDAEDTIPIAAKIKVAQDVLDRAGHAAIKKVQGSMLHGHFTRDDLEEIKGLARDSGVIVDVTPE